MARWGYAGSDVWLLRLAGMLQHVHVGLSICRKVEQVLWHAALACVGVRGCCMGHRHA